MGSGRSRETKQTYGIVNDRFAQTETSEVESLRFEMIAKVYRVEDGKLLDFAEAAGLPYQRPPHIAEKLRQYETSGDEEENSEEDREEGEKEDHGKEARDSEGDEAEGGDIDEVEEEEDEEEEEEEANEPGRKKRERRKNEEEESDGDNDRNN